MNQDAAMEEAFAALLIERDKLEAERDEARRACVGLAMQDGVAAHEILVVSARLWGGRAEALRLFPDEELHLALRAILEDEDFDGDDQDLLELLVTQNHQELDTAFPPETP